jgi:hypothetical protein
MPERLTGASRAAPSGAPPPLGHLQHTLCERCPTSGRRFGCRMCLRCGCGRIYQARRWNQRYCQDTECLKLVRRWQATKRQQERRSCPEVRRQHAAAERDRRARRRAEGCHENRPPCGGTPEEQSPRSAWSRSKKFPFPFCDRPGCYDAVRSCCRRRARYCSHDCLQAVRRVRDRERKWLSRNTAAGQFKRSLEYKEARRARLAGCGQEEAARDGPSDPNVPAGRRL